MRRANRDAIFALASAWQPERVKNVGDATLVVYDLNDGRDHSGEPEFADMSEAEHYAFVLKMFRKAERMLA